MLEREIRVSYFSGRMSGRAMEGSQASANEGMGSETQSKDIPEA
jgi:hypothetical protein